MDDRREDAGQKGRLDALVARSLPCTRSDAKALVRSGHVQVGDRIVRDPGFKVAGEVVSVRGVAIDPPKERWTLILHKPTGCACSHDPGEAPLVYDLLGARERTARVEAAGRLDRETSGLLLLTNDGQLVQRLTHPRRHVWKTYRGTYRGLLAEDAVERCARGLTLQGDDSPTLPARLRLLEIRKDGGLFELEIREGRYRQVRRMVAALGAEVTALARTRIGGLELPPDLAPGASRTATPDEIGLLFAPAQDRSVPPPKGGDTEP